MNGTKSTIKKTTYEKRSGEKTQELTKTWVCSLPLAAFTTFTQGVVILSRFLSCLQAYIYNYTFSILHMYVFSQKPFLQYGIVPRNISSCFRKILWSTWEYLNFCKLVRLEKGFHFQFFIWTSFHKILNWLLNENSSLCCFGRIFCLKNREKITVLVKISKFGFPVCSSFYFFIL